MTFTLEELDMMDNLVDKEVSFLANLALGFGDTEEGSVKREFAKEAGAYQTLLDKIESMRFEQYLAQVKKK
jgi:hypothetical protein